MGAEREGDRKNAVATKVVNHRAPVVEKHFSGIAFKSTNTQGAPYTAPTLTAPAAASQIQVGEAFVIEIGDLREVLTSLLPGGVAEGDGLWIVEATNALSATSGAGKVPFGRIDSIDVEQPGRTLVNLDERGVI